MMPHQAVAMGWQYLQTGNIAAAEAAVRPLMAAGVGDNLVPLIGAIRMQQGRLAEAAPLLERARKLHPEEIRFVFLHGTALAGTNQFARAAEAFKAVIGKLPNIADGYLALGQVQRKQGQSEEALNTYRKLLRVQPSNADAYLALSSALAELRRFEEAEAPLRRALQCTTDPKTLAAIHNNLAIVLENQNKHEQALESLEQTGALAPDLPGLGQRRINSLTQLGRFEDCLLLYRKMLEQNPADAQTHNAYNSMLHRLGRKEEYLASYDRAPQTREIVLGKAAMLMLQKRAEEAGEIYNRLLARDPLDMAAAAAWANCLMVMGRHDESVKAFEAVIKHGVKETVLFSNAAGAALLAGDPQKAEQLCQAGLLTSRYDQTCLALLGTAWRLQENAWDEDLNRYESLIQVFDFDPPDGFSSMEDFNAELGAYLESIHPSTDAYLEQSLHGGTQTEGNIFGTGHAMVERLRPRIEQAISSFVASLPADDRHPFLSRRGGNLSYSGAWSCMMRGKGFHENHLHPKGWISSAYYVSVPEETKDAETRNGWIKFGEPSLNVPLKNPIRRAVQPRAGRLVLFPSYMWHGTVPLNAASLRTTIAFDVVPG